METGIFSTGTHRENPGIFIEKGVSMKLVKKKNTVAKKRDNPDNMKFGKFAAIDFETADYGRDSACALAVVVAENGVIVDKRYSLIRPPRRDFVFSYLHGITWSDVAKKPTFGEYWPEIKGIFDGVDFIAAHNASFDRGVLTTCCSMDGHSAPENNYLCTMKLARRLWNIYPTKLSDVCRHFTIALNHHEAASDALACAKIVLNASGPGVPKSAFLKKT
jgi:DNA polymerase-3 subunit epsilon